MINGQSAWLFQSKAVYLSVIQGELMLVELIVLHYPSND